MRPIRFKQTAVLKGHEATITAVAVHVYENTGRLLLVSTATDGTVIVWKREKIGSPFEVLQVLNFGSKLVESVAMSRIPGTSSVFLACGSVDNLVHVFALDEAKIKFFKLTTLSGHESWVRSLAFAEFVNKTTGTPYMLLASAAQDRRVRLWKMEATSATPAPPKRLDPAALLAQLEDNEEGQLEIEQHSVIITLPSTEQRWSVQLESIILGHDDWVLSARWMPPIATADGSKLQLPRLLTASMDKTMVVWTPDPVTSLWVEATRVGEVGGNHLGFFGGLYSAQPRESILALGYNGAFHLWTRIKFDPSEYLKTTSADAVSAAMDLPIEEWGPEVTISGHFGDVKDVAWDPSGNYFLSVSKDQTARLWARWTHKEAYLQKTLGNIKPAYLNNIQQHNWHELARPQVHGHDLSNAVFQAGIPHRFISCAEEKVLRVFDAPIAFIRSMTNLTEGITITDKDSGRAASANVPALGLSNKPVFEKAASSDTRNDAERLYDEIHPNGGYSDYDMNPEHDGNIPLVLSAAPPFEDQLLHRTLWPEVSKLYGHGNELVTVTSSRTGDIIASACSCKVQTQEQAGIRIWDTSIWKETCELAGPSLTVTQMQFSHCDRYLLAVSRDRGVYLFQRPEPLARKLALCVPLPKAHLRVVWSCSWTWDDQFVATGSRDRFVKVWKFQKEPTPALTEVLALKFKQAVTAVAWVPRVNSSDYVLAVGLENGGIELWRSDLKMADGAQTTTTQMLELHAQDVHVDSIKKLAWVARSDKEYQLASGSSDGSVRLFSLRLEDA